MSTDYSDPSAPPGDSAPGGGRASRWWHRLWHAPISKEDEAPDRGPSEERAAALRALLERDAAPPSARGVLISVAGAVALIAVVLAVLVWTLRPATRTFLESSGERERPAALPAEQADRPEESTHRASDATGQREPAGDNPETMVPAARGDASGQLDIRSKSASVRVEIDGIVRGRPPLHLASLAPGEYEIRVETSKTLETARVRVLAGQVTRVVVPIARADARGSRDDAPDVFTQTPPVRSELDSAEPEGPPSQPIKPEPVTIEDEPPIIPTGAPEAPVIGAASTPPSPVDEQLPPIPAPFPRPPGARIVLDLTIGADGSVEAVSVRESADPSVEATIVSAARRWRYQPATRNGAPVPSVRSVEIALSR